MRVQVPPLPPNAGMVTPRDSKSDVLGSKQASLCQTILDFGLPILD
ncbi:hypothetical protein [Nostoc sp.]